MQNNSNLIIHKIGKFNFTRVVGTDTTNNLVNNAVSLVISKWIIGLIVDGSNLCLV